MSKQEPPSSWEDADIDNSFSKFAKLNVNAAVFVPGGHFQSSAQHQQQSSLFPPTSVQSHQQQQMPASSVRIRPPTTPPSTPVSSRHHAENSKQQTIAVENNLIENDRHKIDTDSKQSLTTTQQNEQDIEKIVIDEEEGAKMEDDIEMSTNEETKDIGERLKMTKQSKEKNIVKHDIIRKKDPVNIIFCGHVDAGKSTIGGQLMFLMGRVDKRTLEKYQTEAQEKNRESWYMAWILDTNEEERDKGKTVEVGRAWFETNKKHFIILDAPGHRCFVPNMISGASQADIAILVISARKGEFETGFERGGQTREHAMLVKTAGVRYMIVLINKMDDPTVNWDKARYEEIKEKLTPYLKKCGFKPGEDTVFMPCSGLSGAVLKEHPGEKILPWYRGPTFIDYLDGLPSIDRPSINGPFRMPIVERYKDMGTIVMGKIESGCVRVGDKCFLMPNRRKVEITNIYYEDIDTDVSFCGENVKLKLKNIEEEEISQGFVLCDVNDVCQVGKVFEAQIAVREHASLITAGYSAVLHIHSAVCEVQLKEIIELIDRKKGEHTQQRFITQDQSAKVRFEINQNSVCMEPFEKFPQLGRFILRDEGKTVAVGKVLKIIE
ncbi:unnamed protein product [Didymodactylos carnosus]|uniref:Tr-type G domain-containing protein n=1 Tax=Didymodactylos carnosus TaxID=1234261 RepID=A0A814Q1F8_9BILA|nr:unnamed protein product [Didymodactylos carnosus]CAF1113948.1 unnamed protein product [Didymodactylos carnosus]CAF3686998.1 unnamed protein product [Didymodactylos carnosus]CAF3878089.1 unnamed protein product [Didymodactylos carnosus]